MLLRNSLESLRSAAAAAVAPINRPATANVVLPLGGGTHVMPDCTLSFDKAPAVPAWQRPAPVRAR